MAAITVTEPIEESKVRGLVNQLDTELQFLLDGAGVPVEVQAKIADCGITTTAIFAGIEADAKDLREFIKTGLTIDPAASIPNKVLTAKLINAWETSVTRGRRRREEEADQRIGDLPRKLPKTSHLELSRAFIKLHGEPKESETPHPDYIEAKLQQLEDGMLLTESMSEIISVEDDDDTAANLGVVLQPDGRLKAKRTSTKKGMVPKTTEELRTKFKVLGSMWELLRLRLPGKPYLVGYDPRIWDKYVSYLLGEKVFNLNAKSVVTAMVCKPPWELVLEYDLEFRKRFTWAFNNKEGTIEAFMNFAYDDTATYQLRFLNPLSVAAGAAAAKLAAESSSSRLPAPGPAWPAFPGAAAEYAAPPADFKGKGKGRKGKDRKGTDRIATQICYRFNRSGCKDSNCRRRHVCSKCDGTDHGAKECKSKGKAHAKGAKL